MVLQKTEPYVQPLANVSSPQFIYIPGIPTPGLLTQRLYGMNGNNLLQTFPPQVAPNPVIISLAQSGGILVFDEDDDTDSPKQPTPKEPENKRPGPTPVPGPKEPEDGDSGGVDNPRVPGNGNEGDKGNPPSPSPRDKKEIVELNGKQYYIDEYGELQEVGSNPEPPPIPPAQAPEGQHEPDLRLPGGAPRIMTYEADLDRLLNNPSFELA